MCYECLADYIIPIVELIVSIFACVFTYLTFKKSRDILEVLDEERKYKWNRKELEKLFSTIPIDSIESFFYTPDIIRNELWEGLRAVDLKTFQYNGIERDQIVKFINGLEEFCFMSYEQVPSGHWNFQPLSEKEPFDAEKEKQMIINLEKKASKLRQQYTEIKKILRCYHVDLRDITNRANGSYRRRVDEENVF